MSLINHNQCEVAVSLSIETSGGNIKVESGRDEV
jgi:hypothetical protein